MLFASVIAVRLSLPPRSTGYFEGPGEDCPVSLSPPPLVLCGCCLVVFALISAFGCVACFAMRSIPGLFSYGLLCDPG